MTRRDRSIYKEANTQQVMSMSRFYLAILCLSILAANINVWASYTDTELPTLNMFRGDTVWEHFNTDLELKSEFRLIRNSANGGVILTPNVDPNDLPDTLLACPGQFDIAITPMGRWNAQGTAEIHSSYDHSPDPVATWPSVSTNIPINWNGANTVQCARTGDNREPINCDSTYARANQNGQAEWAANPAQGNLNVDYRRRSDGNTFFDKQAMAGLLCDGRVSFNGVNNYITETEHLIAGPVVTTTTTLAPKVDVNRCRPNVEAMPSNAPNADYKYFWFNNGANNQLPSTLNKPFQITIANPLACQAEFVSMTYNGLPFTDITDLGQMPLPTNTAYEITITVRNPNPDIYIQAEGIEFIPPNPRNPWWTIATSTANTPNGFGTPIAPGDTQVLHITLISPPDEPVVGPLRMRINFRSSTNLCDNTLCTSTLDITPGLPVDLASLALVNTAEADIGETVMVEAVTYNSGLVPIPMDTVTSVDLGLPSLVFFNALSTDLPPANYPGPDGIHPDFYVSQFFPYVCEFPHIAYITVKSDNPDALVETDEVNNYATAIINCGNVLGCYDYM